MKLLLAIDGSEYSHRALDFLQAFTLPPETELTLLTVVDKEAWPEGLDDARLTGEQRDSLQKMRDMLGADAEKLLEEGCSRLADRQVRCRTRKRFGQPAEEIVNAAAELDADLVIMGSHGHGDIERFLLGSVSDQVLHHAHCSVLVVRADQPPAGDNQPSPDIPLRILLAYDDSIHARRASEFCATLPLPGDTRVTAVSVLPLVTAYRQDIRLHQGWMWQEKRKVIEQGLRRVTSEIDWPTPHVDWQIRESPDICDELIRAIDDLKSQLLVVGHKGENAIKRFLKGSIARRITHHAPCSILVVKSEQ